MYFSLNYDVSKLHHISLAELNFKKNELDKRASFLRLKIVFKHRLQSVWII